MLPPEVTGSGASVLPMFSTGADDTVVGLEERRVGAEWRSRRSSDPLKINVPLARGVVTATTSCTLLDAPAASAPMFQVTTPAASVPPPVADTNAVFAGMVSVITTPVAFMLPVFE